MGGNTEKVEDMNLVEVQKMSNWFRNNEISLLIIFFCILVLPFFPEHICIDIITRFELGQKSANAAIVASVIKMQSSEALIEMQYGACSEEFFIKIDENLQTINLFFAEKMSYCSRKFQEIEQAWTLIKGKG